MNEWQPIATAPRDKTAVLLGRAGKSMPIFARWIPADEDWQIMMIDEIKMLGADNAPTHWMPVPKPPTV